MVRSGLLVIVLVGALVGCSAAPPSEPTPTSPTVAACPEGLTEALRAHLSTQPWNGELPAGAAVDSDPDATFTSSLVRSMVGCHFTTEIRNAAGDRMMQIFGVADGLDEVGVIAEFKQAGWEPLPGATGVWQDPEDIQEGAQIYPRGVAGGRPALDFPDWDDYLGPGDVLLLGSIPV
jgi:hypothetical protein